MAGLNHLQRVLHRVFMLRPVTAFFAPRIHHIDKMFLKLTRGRYTGSGLVGWNIVLLTTTGAKSGQPRTMPLIALSDGEKLALIASSFGREHNPGWYYNLKAYPECEVLQNGKRAKYIARETSGDEYERYWQMAVAAYAGYERYKQHASHRRIPVMVLEPKR